MILKKIFVSLFLTCSLTSCLHPWLKYERYKHPPVPDYSLMSSWSALPDKKDSADALPLHSNLKDEQPIAKADVFFIHPTTFLNAKNWNADVNDKHLNKATDQKPIRFQASVFNGSCKVYAPRYRQATLSSFFDTLNGNKALDLAYEDIKAAFTYYLLHYNQGRPVIIASHSQGTWLGIRLLKDFFDNDSILRKRLVAAYLIGGPATDHEYLHIPSCDSAGQTGCYIGWGSFKWGNHSMDSRYKNFLCVNPLTWKRDETLASKELNLGGVPSNFSRIDPHICDAKCMKGKLWVHKPNKKGYISLFGNYHIEDYEFFYMNIRQNVAYRIERYFEINN